MKQIGFFWWVLFFVGWGSYYIRRNCANTVWILSCRVNWPNSLTEWKLIQMHKHFRCNGFMRVFHRHFFPSVSRREWNTNPIQTDESKSRENKLTFQRFACSRRTFPNVFLGREHAPTCWTDASHQTDLWCTCSLQSRWRVRVFVHQATLLTRVQSKVARLVLSRDSQLIQTNTAIKTK